MRLIGERSWVTALLLYLPRVLFALPLPFLLSACLVAGDVRGALAVGLTALLLVVFPLMGFQIIGRNENAATSIRVMTWNTFRGRIDNASIRRLVAEENPDIFFAQAMADRTEQLFHADPGDYVVDRSDELLVATRYPIVERYLPPGFADDPKHHPNFIRYTLNTPLGLIDVYNLHPKSPRDGLDLRRLANGAGTLRDNTLLRRRQIDALAAACRASQHPVLVAGDTNLPTLSWLFHSAFSQLRDGFVDAGTGLGYTFPARRPWLRIDRILADASFRFLRFRCGRFIASDHLYLVAELTTAPGKHRPVERRQTTFTSVGSSVPPP